MDKLIKPKNSMSLHVEVNLIISKIKCIIQEIPNFQALKLNHDLTLYILNLVNSLIKSKKIDVQTVSSKILCDIFQLNSDEVDTLNKQIQFLIESNAITKYSKTYIVLLKIQKNIFGFLKNK